MLVTSGFASRSAAQVVGARLVAGVLGGAMEGMITRVSVTWTEGTGSERRDMLYTVVPDEKKIIRAERLEELLDDLTVICEQLQAAQDATANGAASSDFGRALRRVK
jgi:hypothetical protein